MWYYIYDIRFIIIEKAKLKLYRLYNIHFAQFLKFNNYIY